MAVHDLSAPHVSEVVDYFTPKQQMACLAMGSSLMLPLHWSIMPTKRSPTHCGGSVMFPLLPVSRSARWEAALLAMNCSKILRHLYFSRRRGLCKITLNKVHPHCQWIPAACQPTEISFSNDKLVFTQSDMDKSNFFIDKNSKACIVDFEDVVLLPESFAGYTMNASDDPLVKKVAGYLRWSSFPNEYSMIKAGRILCIISDTTLGP
ncbi:hypothetical protein IW261DRAFT_324738 [Armillaria novae-zelandiae]|uniref:Uncharacterized protein n=1 Tax=Armillaria novae-zelandiae TaxID=153914 RepID=A0AA39P4A9_9AGAR|nr:hypothetical protein IW261DRAFT_324738 [Armillaria novae-zelandiae]